MGDFDRRNAGHRGGHNRKRRFREDDEFDRRPPRRQYQEPVHVKVRKQLLAIAESPLKKIDEEVQEIATIVADNYEDEEIRGNFLELALQLVVEQALKIPFVAAVVLAVNVKKPELAYEVLTRSSTALNKHFNIGAWREVKLLLRFLGCLQAILNDEGVFPVLEELFSRAVDLQTASSDDGLGLEIVKIILLTIPYIMASSAPGLEAFASALLEKTDIIASAPRPLEALVDPYPSGEDDDTSHQAQSIISLLQRQLQTEAAQSWKLACIPRPWRTLPIDGGAKLMAPTKHSLPSIIVPSSVSAGARPQLPEMYFSVYADQDVETVPPTSNIASSILRDALVDTISILDYNRNATAKFLIDLDCYFAPETFVKRATPFDRLREVDEGKSTWKPEDVAVDAVFSQLLQLPTPEHKLVYYHAVLTESCKIAPAAIAPSLGRAIRFLYRNVDAMDLELEYRFLDWFSHHLSNFGFTWKWTEWVDDVELPLANPKKAFIVGALEKEIRLSFAQRIRGTLPEPYQALITEAKEKDTPDFKYNSDRTPYAPQAREVLRLLRAKASDSEIQVQLSSIESEASGLGIAEPLIPSTDAYMTAICFIGSKSLSHVLSCIERCKERLLALGPRSEAARRQIITSVMEYWSEKPGVGVNVVDKLLNYTILTPLSVINWALTDNIGKGRLLTLAHIYEMVASTLHKVTNRVRQIVIARNQAELPAEQKAMLDETLEKERSQMKELFATVEDSLTGVASGVVDEMAESRDQDTEGEALLRIWGGKWLRVFRRKMAVEESWIEEMLAKQPAEGDLLDGPERGADEMVEGNGIVEGQENWGGDGDIL
ncbi:Nuclear cap-binding protein subunit 1 [Xanthoria parietina]